MLKNKIEEELGKIFQMPVRELTSGIKRNGSEIYYQIPSNDIDVKISTGKSISYSLDLSLTTVTNLESDSIGFLSFALTDVEKRTADTNFRIQAYNGSEGYFFDSSSNPVSEKIIRVTAVFDYNAVKEQIKHLKLEA